MSASAITYNAPKTISEFMRCDALVRAVLGPFGSGKTTGMLMELIRRATEEYPDANNVRKTRMVVIRNTSPQLRTTVLPEIEKWLQPAFRYKVVDATLQFRFDLADGTRVESDWLLLPLDTPQDVQRLLSLNVTGAWISEFREVSLEIVQALLGRIGRYRSVGLTKSKWFGIIMESNMPDDDSAWYNKLEIEKPDSWEVFKQPSGISPDAENIENLREGYYQTLLDSNTPDWCDVHVHAKYGKSLSGQAVFRASFNPGFHVTYKPLKHDPRVPLTIAQDFGRTPACLIGQMDHRGRLLVFAEATSTDMGLQQFLNTELRPLYYRRFPGTSAFVVADPSGRHKSQLNEESAFDVLNKSGYKVYGAPTNDIDPRIRSVESLLLKQVDAGPLLLIDGGSCPLLVQAMKARYRYRRKQTGDLEEKPEKSHPWSDLADCLQYMCLSVNGNYTAKLMNEGKTRISAPRPVAASWT